MPAIVTETEVKEIYTVWELSGFSHTTIHRSAVVEKEKKDSGS